MEEEKKRLFFGLQIEAPWPSSFPKGRTLDEAHRHITLAFLGSISLEKTLRALQHPPMPSFKVGKAGIFEACLLLPQKHPRVAAWSVNFLEGRDVIFSYREVLIRWLIEENLLKEDQRKWLPHLTLCRPPFEKESWQNSFVPLPFIYRSIYLYESLGNSNYLKLWSLPLYPPFEAMEHTADIGFIIRGETLLDIYRHAQIALAFSFPPLLPFLNFGENKNANLDQIIIDLNSSLCTADSAIGAPFKAVSFHGELEEIDRLLQWEMIIDV